MFTSEDQERYRTGGPVGTLNAEELKFAYEGMLTSFTRERYNSNLQEGLRFWKVEDLPIRGFTTEGVGRQDSRSAVVPRRPKLSSSIDSDASGTEKV